MSPSVSFISAHHRWDIGINWNYFNTELHVIVKYTDV